MALEDDVRILSGVALFRGFTDDQLRLLAFGAETLELSTDMILFQEGDQADGGFVVISGQIELYRETERGAVSLGIVKPGSLIGEIALIAPTHRLTHAAALVDSRVLRVNRRTFRRILEEYPEIAGALLKRMSDEFHALVARVERIGTRLRR